jgi:hypothetical protein
MDIDAFKDSNSQINAPEGLDSFVKENSIESGGIIDQLKRADKRSKIVLRRFYIAYFSIATVYFTVFIVNPDPDLKLYDRINGSLLFMGIILFAVLAKRKHFKLSHVNYDQNTLAFLHDALARYKFWTPDMKYLVLGVVVVNVGSCRSYLMHYPQFDDILMDLLLFQAVFLFLMAIGLFFGFRHWNTHRKPIYIDIVTLLRKEA